MQNQDFELQQATYVLAPRPIAHTLGLFAAVVYGAVWGFCQMSLGYCSASVPKIAAQACVSTSTVRRELKRLVASGYLTEEPQGDHQPNIYRITPMMRLKTRVTLDWEIDSTYSTGTADLLNVNRSYIQREYQKEELRDELKQRTKKRNSTERSVTENQREQQPNKQRRGVGRRVNGKIVVD